ncbi:m-AAA protease-interacting protein 1, mitochondrial isoform X1 [Pipistrellus kuhlii]|uniref:Matrix AAA peptidase interacting protein 1 n=1 Tax=Pipistrellus kuhlii TaxID=59472 RepID=A0A7J7XVG0_PIPKU|nr:m-AAA protease-interacting protein 1, mitochondrial isoform X1 [Pipistrellus kuhlii]KAF6353619.1 matrix AAA peptidase interacting protein 1 [Pipistrellus kuhlii]
MALAARLWPRWLLAGSLPGGAARLRSPGRAAGRPPWAGLCCLCRRHLGWAAAPCPPAPWAAALPARDPRRRPLLSSAAPPACPRRSYGTEEPPQQRPKTKMLILGFSNPINWVRTRIFAFLIWAYFDKEFSIKEFSEGAKQAFAHVSKLLSQCKFDLLEELVTKELLLVLKEKVTSLPDSHKDALAADIEEIVYTSAGDISIYYDDKGRKFVNILMCFWYLTSANIPSETLSGAGVFQVKLGNQNVETKQLLSASYEFQREFTQGVKPNWIIARIDHAKLLE